MSSSIDKFNKLKSEGEQLSEQGSKISDLFENIEKFAEEVAVFRGVLEGDDSVSEDEMDDMMEELYDIKYDTTSWLPSSMQC